MSRKKIIIISAIILIIIVIAGCVVMLNKGSSDTSTPSSPDSPKSANSSTTDMPSQPTINPDTTSDQQSTLYYSPSTGTITITDRSNQELIDTMVKTPSLVASDGRPVFDIVNVQRVDSIWYVVKIRNIIDPSVGEAWVILKDKGSGGGLSTFVGPGTSFINVDMPDNVRSAIK